MRFSELHPCDDCGEGLGVVFFRIELSRELVNVAQARTRHGLDVMFPGAPGLAASLHGDGDDGTKSEHAGRALLCMVCVAKLLESDGLCKAIERAAAKEASNG